MDVPLHLTYRDFPPSDALTAHVERRCEKLDGLFDHIVACRVAIEAPHRHQRHGKRYHVRVDLVVPGGELVVGRTPSDELVFEDAYAAVEHAFDAIERLLEDYARKLRGDVKRVRGSQRGRVTKLMLGYGFLETQDGREVYFHENSVLHDQFARLRVGTMVRFAEEDGDKGPQASTVAVAGRHELRRANREGNALGMEGDEQAAVR